MYAIRSAMSCSVDITVSMKLAGVLSPQLSVAVTVTM